MKISQQEAISILEIKERIITQEMIKKAYRLLAKKYHPDREHGDSEKMKLVNVAYRYLSENDETFYNEPPKYSYHQQQTHEEMLYDTIRGWGLNVYREGHKVWVSGKTYNFKENLKAHKFRWCPDEKKWWRYS